jgi:hypothetical protein
VDELKVLIMDAGYVLEYAHEVDGRLAQDIRDRETWKVVGTLLHPKREEWGDIDDRATGDCSSGVADTCFCSAPCRCSCAGG